LYSADIECGNKLSVFDRNMLTLAAEQCWIVSVYQQSVVLPAKRKALR